MASSLSIDLRERVVAAMAAGASQHKAAERFGVSVASASRWCGQMRATGDCRGVEDAAAARRPASSGREAPTARTRVRRRCCTLYRPDGGLLCR